MRFDIPPSVGMLLIYVEVLIGVGLVVAVVKAVLS